jgi:hypothetical protein
MNNNQFSFLISIQDLSQINLETDQNVEGGQEIVISMNPGTISSMSIEEERIIILSFDKGELRISLSAEEISALLHVISKGTDQNE